MTDAAPSPRRAGPSALRIFVWSVLAPLALFTVALYGFYLLRHEHTGQQAAQQIQRLQADRQQLTQELANANAEVAKGAQALAATNAKLDATKANLTEKSGTLHDMQGQLKALMDQAQSDQATIADLKAKLASSVQDQQAAAQQIATLKQANTDLRQAARAAQAQAAQAQKALAERPVAAPAPPAPTAQAKTPPKPTINASDLLQAALGLGATATHAQVRQAFPHFTATQDTPTNLVLTRGPVRIRNTFDSFANTLSTSVLTIDGVDAPKLAEALAGDLTHNLGTPVNGGDLVGSAIPSGHTVSFQTTDRQAQLTVTGAHRLTVTVQHQGFADAPIQVYTAGSGGHAATPTTTPAPSTTGSAGSSAPDASTGTGTP